MTQLIKVGTQEVISVAMSQIRLPCPSRQKLGNGHQERLDGNQMFQFCEERGEEAISHPHPSNLE